MGRNERAANAATRAALDAVGAAVRGSYDRARFTIDRFGRHPDGYLHARVVVDGQRSVYFHCRFGSWLAPGQFQGREQLKEPEALLGSDLGRAVKYALAAEADKFQPRRTHDATAAPSTTPDTRGDGQTVPASPVSTGRNRTDAA